MNIEEARRIANEKFTKLIQPLINQPSPELGEGVFEAQAQALIKEIAQETGYEVDRFYVQPLGYGMYEVTTIFRHGEKRRRTLENLLLN